MHMLNIQLLDRNQDCVLGLSGNIFSILHNIPTVFSIMYFGYSCEWIVYAGFIVINLHIGNKICCGEGESCESEIIG